MVHLVVASGPPGHLVLLYAYFALREVSPALIILFGGVITSSPSPPLPLLDEPQRTTYQESR